MFDAVVRGLAQADLACLHGSAEHAEFGTTFGEYIEWGLQELELYLARPQLGPA